MRASASVQPSPPATITYVGQVCKLHVCLYPMHLPERPHKEDCVEDCLERTRQLVPLQLLFFF